MLQQKLTAIIVACATAAVMLMSGGVAHAQTDKPNILVIWGDDEARGFLVPLVAIAQGDEAAQGYIFKYGEATNLVSKVPIRSGKGIANNLIEIVEGVAAGDIIAAAGVSFLRDGQHVKLLGQ